MRHFGQRIGLIHELGQGIGAEERIDDGRNGLRINQVCRSKHLIVADIHTLTNRTAHTSQTYRELIGKLLAYRTDATVAQVVDIIYRGLGINQLDEILDNLDDIFLRQDTNVHIGRQVQLAVDAVTADLAQVITFVREEQIINDLACGTVVLRIGVAQLTVYVIYGLLFGVARVFLKGIEND